jgi:hypothetical protein
MDAEKQKVRPHHVHAMVSGQQHLSMLRFGMYYAFGLLFETGSAASKSCSSSSRQNRTVNMLLQRPLLCPWTSAFPSRERVASARG